MKIKALKKLLYIIINAGYGDWEVNFCDDDDDDDTVNHIFVDDDGDICLKSTDAEYNTYSFTAVNILNRIKRYDNDDYVYFVEEYEDESYCSFDIEFNWYIGTDCDYNDILNIDCTEIDDDDDYLDWDSELPKVIDCPGCGGGKAKWDGEYYRCRICGFCGSESYGRF